MKAVTFISWFPFAFLLNNLYLVDLLKNWCFWTVMLEKTLESPLDAGRSSHSTLRKSTLNIHWKDWCWGWSSHTLATWYKESTHWKRPWCWERLRERGEKDDRGRWWDSIADSVDMDLSKFLKIVGERGARHAEVHGVTKSRTRLSDWTTTSRLHIMKMSNQTCIY